MLAAISFDCYGTLVDWEAGITSFLTQTFRDKGLNANVRDVFRAREDIEFDMIQARYRSYAEILRQSLREAFERFSVPYSNRDGERLAESVPSWPLFGDTKPALERLENKCNLAIISNIDNDIIEKTKARLGVRFHLTVTAQDVQAYKPSTRPFQIALQKLACEPQQVLHVSSGFRYDIPPAHELGFKTAWLNRKSEPSPPTGGADHEFKSLIKLATFVESQTNT